MGIDTSTFRHIADISLMQTARETIEEWYDKEYQKLDDMLRKGIISPEQYDEETKFLQQMEKDDLDDIKNPF